MIPHYKQKKEWWCGPAVVQMALAARNITLPQASIARMMRTTRTKGTANRSMVRPFKHFLVPHKIFKGKEELIKSLKRKEIVIVNYYHVKDQVGHFAIVKHIKNKHITLIDPSEGPNYTMPLEEFLNNWYGSAGDKRWGMSVAN